MASSEQKAASALADAASKLTDTTTPSYEGEERKLYGTLCSTGYLGSYWLADSLPSLSFN